MYEDVLVPTDGSDAVQDAIEEGIDIAELCDATLHAVFVVDTADYALVPDAELMTIEEALENAGRRALEDVERRAAAAGLETRTELRRGGPADGIVDYADEHGVDLIVMGTRGRSAIDRVLLGSVAENVIRNADQPVMVKRLEE